MKRLFLALGLTLLSLVAHADQTSIVVPENSTEFKNRQPNTATNFDNAVHYFINPALRSIASNFFGTSCSAIQSPVPYQWCVDTGARQVRLYTAPAGSSAFSWQPAFNINSDGSVGPTNLTLGAVSSVAGRSGSVLLTSTDLTDSTTLGRGLVGAANAAAAKSLLAITAGDVSGLAASATTDTTNAVNLTSGTLPRARLPADISGLAAPVEVNLNRLGADPTGVADAATLINATAAGSLCSAGCVMTLDTGTYKIGSTLNFGNGTSSAGSTINNIRLEGRVNPKLPPTFTGYATQTGGVTLLWSGGAAPVIDFKGPMQNWGLSKLYIDCNSTATYGVHMTSAQYGVSDHVNIAGCQVAGLMSTTFLPFGSFTNTDSFRNRYDDFVVSVPDVDGAKGVWLTAGAGPTVVGGSTVAADTDYNVWNNLVTWNAPATSTHINYGLYLQATDGNFFFHFKPAIFNSQSISLAFDYTITPFWPEGNYFFGIEPGNPINIGTPTAVSRPNVFYGVVEGNGNKYPTDLQNTQSAMPAVFGSVIDLQAQTSALSLRNAILTPFKTGMYRVSYYLSTTTVGTAGNISVQWQWNDSGAVQNRISSNVSATSLGYTEDSFVVFLVGGSDLNYQTNMVGTTGSPAYQLHARVERLD